MSQLGCMGSGNKLQGQKKGPWSLGETKEKVKPLGIVRGKGKERETEQTKEH